MLAATATNRSHLFRTTYHPRQPQGLPGRSREPPTGLARPAAPNRPLTAKCETRLYQAKHARCGYRLYAPDQDGYSRDRLALVDELRVAIDNGDLDVYYQPQAEFATGRITGVEALVHWQHPTSGLLGPDTFIPVAEQSGLMRPLTALVLERALKQYGEWKRTGLD